MGTKKELRKIYLNKRAKLTMQEMHAFLASMVDCFREVPILAHGLTLSYNAIVDKKEVDPDVFEQVHNEENNPRGICYPAADFASGDMTAFMDDEDLVWENPGFGLTQPRSGKRVDPLDIDIVFVPLLAFDEQGFRLGYGKGFYDRFLKTCRPDVLKIGFCWFEAETSLPEIGAHDVPLNYCVTPQRLYVF
jgi:5-formyltetrahydrofolate cyclo-ligase